MSDPIFVVTIDTEVDRSLDWSISSPATFTSVTRAVPAIFMPLFRKYGVVPTFLLSPEVIEDDASAAALDALDDEIELGTHLHGEFAEPLRTFDRTNMAGRRPADLQCSYEPETELAKLTWLTRRFESRFGRRPRSFRAGRFGLSRHTPAALSSLGYVTDTSVTPGLLWRDPGGVADFRAWTSPAPRTLGADNGSHGILEIPVTILPRHPWSSLLGRSELSVAPGLVGRALRRIAPFDWLRPSFNTGHGMIDVCRRVVSTHRDGKAPIVLNMMLHNVEVIAGASPYAATETQAENLVARMDEVFSFAHAEGYVFRGLSAAADALS